MRRHRRGRRPRSDRKERRSAKKPAREVRRIYDPAESARGRRCGRVLRHLDAAGRRALRAAARACGSPSLSALLHRSADVWLRRDGGDRESRPGARRNFDGRARAAGRQGAQERVAARDGRNGLRVSSRFWLAAREADARGSIRDPDESQLRRSAMIEAARGFGADVRFEYPHWFDERRCRALSSSQSVRSCCSGSSSTPTRRSSRSAWRRTALTFTRRTPSATTASASPPRFARRCERADGVVTTGGLGPTVDDLTKEAVCDALGLGTELYEPALRADGGALCSTRTPDAREQSQAGRAAAREPSACDNPNGTAPGFIAFAGDGKFVACMPGVPREMKPMLVEQVVPFLRERLADAATTIYTRVLHTIGIGRIGDRPSHRRSLSQLRRIRKSRCSRTIFGPTSRSWRRRLRRGGAKR